MKSYWLLDCEIDASQAYVTTSSAPMIISNVYYYFNIDCEIDASQAIETTSSAPSAYLVTLKSGRSFLVQGDRGDDDEDGDKRWIAPSAYLVILKSGRAFLVKARIEMMLKMVIKD